MTAYSRDPSFAFHRNYLQHRPDRAKTTATSKSNWEQLVCVVDPMDVALEVAPSVRDADAARIAEACGVQ